MQVHLFFPEAGSLKGKRAELNRVKALLRERLHVSVAEVAHQDAWQRSTLAVAIAAGFECGVVLANYSNVEEGDTMEVYETRQVERTLS